MCIIDSVRKLNVFIETSFPSSTPQWTTENKIVLQTKAFILRKFGESDFESTIVIPPQAGHSSHIADFDNGQSIVESILSQRNGSVYCIEWLSSTQKRKNESISDLLKQVKQVFNFVGKSHLIGLCQGGWLSAMFSAINPDIIESLTCIAAPIDFHNGGGVIYDTCTKLGIETYKHYVDQNNGIMSGENMLLGWKLMSPIDRFLTDYVKIIGILDDKEKIRKTHKFRTWYETTQDLSGRWYLEAVSELFIKNKLVRKEFIIDGKVVDLNNIYCPVVMIAGEKDDITLMSHLFELENHVSSVKINKIVIPDCGHIGAFMSSKSQKYIKESVKWIDNNC